MDTADLAIIRSPSSREFEEPSGLARESALPRALAGRPVERYDADSYLARVAENYRRLAKADATAVILDGAVDREDVEASILATVKARFASNT